MKNFKLLPLTALLMGVLAFQACDNDDHYYYYPGYALPNALVTVKQNADENVTFLQLDDSTTLLPVNITNEIFGGKQVRALVNYDKVNYPSSGYDYAVHVNWIDSILTKPAMPHSASTDAAYGNDPVEIVKDWVTIAEDGYLTLRFRTRWGGGQKHFVNLVYGSNPTDPYEVTFRHNAHGDLNGNWGDGLVAFRLDGLPDTEGKTVKLTLRWNSFSGEKQTTFDYCTRQAGGAPATALTEERSIVPLQ